MKKHLFIQDPRPQEVLACWKCTNDGIKPVGTGYMERHYFNAYTLEVWNTRYAPPLQES